MKISIITINYNNKPGLIRTFESVFSQSFKDFEYIFIDGGSTDGSKEVIENNFDKITYWVSEKDKGIYDAKLIIGSNVGMSSTFICCTDEIIIGDRVNLGVGTKIYDTDFHPIDFAIRRTNPGFDLSKIPHTPIKLGDDVWVGASICHNIKRSYYR